MNIQVAGENALIIYFADQVSDETSQTIQMVAAELSVFVGDELIDLVPSYASMLVIFNPLVTDHLYARKLIAEASQNSQVNKNQNQSQQQKIISLPVYYGLEAAPDLSNLAQSANLSVEEVIDIHSSMAYRVYAIGFAPGFAYLGEVDKRIAAPRLATPRKKVPKGAVAIADRQTAVYSAESPGGWNLIGLCPLDMFNPKAMPSMPFQVGDKVSFRPIDLGEFIALGGQLPLENLPKGDSYAN